MPLSKTFKLTVMKRIQEDSNFRLSFLMGAINEFLSGDINVGKSMLRDYIHATISFITLANNLGKNSKSLQRMLGPNGNPTTDSLFEIIRQLQFLENIQLTVQAEQLNQPR